MKLKTRLTIIILFATITRLLLLYYYPLHLTDYHLIQTAADNLINGYGMGFQRSSVQDLSIFYFEGLRLWPPLVTIITALMNWITGNPLLADSILVSIGMIGLIWIIYKLAKKMNLNENWIQILLLFLAVNPEIIKQPGLGDIISAAFCMWGILVTADWIKSGSRKNVLQILAIALVIFLPSAFRYQYYPISALLPMAILLYATYEKDKKLLKAGLVCLTVVMSLIFLQEIMLYWYTKHTITTFIEKDNKGIYPGNLTETYPFFFKTFLNTSYIENTFQSFLLQVRKRYFLLSFLLFGGWLYLLIRKTKSISKKEVAITWLLVTVLIVIIVTLAGLSATHESQLNVHGKWTYVMEGRYYIVPSLLILLLSIWLLQEKQKNLNRNLRKAITVFLTMSLMYNGLLTIKFYYNIVNKNLPIHKNKMKGERQIIGDFLYKQASESNIPMVIVTEDPSVGFYTYHNNIAVAEAPKDMEVKYLNTSHPVKLYIIFVENYSNNENKLLIPETAIKELETANYLVYSLRIEPHQPVQLSQ